MQVPDPGESVKDKLAALEISSAQAVALLEPHLQGLARSYFSRVINQPELWQSSDAVKVKRGLCRLVLLPQALALKIDRDKAWHLYGEHVLFGLPEPMKAEVLAEAEAIVEQRRLAAIAASAEAEAGLNPEQVPA